MTVLLLEALAWRAAIIAAPTDEERLHAAVQHLAALAVLTDAERAEYDRRTERSRQVAADEQVFRDADGRYRCGFGRVCVCGHTAGQHTAARVKRAGAVSQECISAGCSCDVFTRSSCRVSGSEARQ